MRQTRFILRLHAKHGEWRVWMENKNPDDKEWIPTYSSWIGPYPQLTLNQAMNRVRDW